MISIDILERQIVLAENLLGKVNNIPNCNRRIDLVALGYVPYDKGYTKPLSIEVDSWEMETKEYLIELYGENSRQYNAFCANIRPKDQYFDFREELKDELLHCISYLNTLIKIAETKEKSQSQVKKDENKKPYKLFISHATEDILFVRALVNLFESMGFNKTNMFCSSIPEYGIELSKDIFQTIRDLFDKYNLYVIFVHSPRYYQKIITLNEMGAAWVLKTDFCSILTNDMDLNEMNGVVNNSTISIKVVDGTDSEARLNELKENLISLFKLDDMNLNTWERKRDEFLEKVRKIKYENSPVVEKESNAQTSSEKGNDDIFTNEEKSLFSKWANNIYDNSYMELRTRRGLEVHMGYKNGYLVESGQEEACHEDFMQRLQDVGYIKLNKLDQHNRPVYSITKKGYDFAKTLN